MCEPPALQLEECWALYTELPALGGEFITLLTC